MASIRLQERLLGFSLGLAGGVGAFIYQQKYLRRSTGVVADVYSGGKLPPTRIHEAVSHPILCMVHQGKLNITLVRSDASQVPEPIFGQKAREQLIHGWNVGIDRTLEYICFRDGLIGESTSGCSIYSSTEN